MDTEEAIAVATAFLKSNRISFSQPPIVIARSDSLIEVIFMTPEALDPNVVVDPPDIRVLVDTVSTNASLAPQM